MARNKELIRERNLIIKNEYNELYENKRLRIDDCFDMLTKKYFLDKQTLQKIVFEKKK